MRMKIKSRIYLFLGWVSFLLGVIGAFLPVMPTTPFLLLSSYFFSRGSTKVHQWLLNLKFFGPQIKNWENHKIITVKAKINAVVLIILSIGFFLYTSTRPLELKVFVFVIAFSVILFILSRSSKKDSANEHKKN